MSKQEFNKFLFWHDKEWERMVEEYGILNRCWTELNEMLDIQGDLERVNLELRDGITPEAEQEAYDKLIAHTDKMIAHLKKKIAYDRRKGVNNDKG